MHSILYKTNYIVKSKWRAKQVPIQRDLLFGIPPFLRPSSHLILKGYPSPFSPFWMSRSQVQNVSKTTLKKTYQVKLEVTQRALK